jgi:hypothetical protein
MTLKQALHRAVVRALVLTIIPACWLLATGVIWEIERGSAPWLG